jgi:opacity protein-like surface antigen
VFRRYFEAFGAEVAELVDALGSGSSGGNAVGVQIPPSAPFLQGGSLMLRRVPLAFTFAFLLVTSPARAGIVGTFYPGVTSPIGDFAADSLGNAETGFQFAAALDATFSRSFSAGVEVSWGVNNNGLEGKQINQGGGFYSRADKYQYDIHVYGVRARYTHPTDSHFHPYALVGVGAYDVDLDYEVSFGGPGLTQEVKQSGKTNFGTRFGGRAGIGFEFEGSPHVLLGLGAEYNYISMDEDKFGSSSAAYWAFRASIGHNFSK